MRRPIASLVPLFLLLAGCISNTGGTRLTSAAGQELDATVRLTILHTNDVHGQVQPRAATWVDPENPPEIGGMLAVATYVKKVRSEVAESGGHLLVTDGGDIFQGTPEGTLTKGDIMVALMNHIGYDLAAVGNHEYDLGQANFERLVAASEFPWLGANVRIESTGELAPYVRSHLIREFGGIRLAILGATTSDMKNVTGAGLTDGLVFEREDAALLRTADGIDKEAVDFWIAVTHSGFDRDKELAAKFDRLGLILGGHSHTGLKNGWVEPTTGVRVYQSFGKASAVTRVDLVFSRRTKELLSIEGGLVDLPIAEYPRDPEAVAVAEPYSRELDRIMAEVVGELVRPLPTGRGWHSSPLGNWLTDIMRAKTGADVALHNKTGIRSDLPAGRLTRRHLFEVSPFANTLVTMKLTGHQIRTLLEESLSEDKKILEMSGATLVLDPRRPQGARILELKIGGVPVDPEAVYRVVTNSFLATGGDGHRIFKEGSERVETGVKMGTDLEEEYLDPARPLDYAFEDRWRLVEEGSEEVPAAAAPPGLGVALALGEPEAASANAQAGAYGEARRARTGAVFETVTPFSDEERLENLRLLARRGTLGVVAAIGDGYAGTILRAASEAEAIRFVLVDPTGPVPDGVLAVDLARDEVGFVLGALAAALAEGRPAVLLVGDRGPEAAELEAGFRAGWKHGGGEGDPPVVAVADGPSGYEAPDLAAARAAEAVEGGAAVVVHAAGIAGESVEKAVARGGALAIGFADPGASRTPGVALRVRLRYDRALEAALSRPAEAGRVRIGLAEGLAEFACPDPAHQARVEELIRAVASGEVRLPEEGR